MNNLEKIAKLESEIEELKTGLDVADQDRKMSIPVHYEGKILIVQLYDDLTALYQFSLKGRVLSECTEPDNASYILDKINFELSN